MQNDFTLTFSRFGTCLSEEVLKTLPYSQTPYYVHIYVFQQVLRLVRHSVDGRKIQARIQSGNTYSTIRNVNAIDSP